MSCFIMKPYMNDWRQDGERCITLLSLDLTYYRHFLGEDLENKDILGVDRNKIMMRQLLYLCEILFL